MPFFVVYQLVTLSWRKCFLQKISAFACSVQCVRGFFGAVIFAEFLLKMLQQSPDSKTDEADGY
jgi:hypothetical protein